MLLKYTEVDHPTNTNTNQVYLGPGPDLGRVTVFRGVLEPLGRTSHCTLTAAGSCHIQSDLKGSSKDWWTGTEGPNINRSVHYGSLRPINLYK